LALFNLETLTFLTYSFRDPKSFALFNLETLTVLAYYLQALFVSPVQFRDTNSPGLFLRDFKGYVLYNLENLTVLDYSFRDSKCLALFFRL